MSAPFVKVLATAVLLLCFLGAVDAAVDVEDVKCVTNGTEGPCFHESVVAMTGTGLFDVFSVSFVEVGMECKDMEANDTLLTCVLFADRAPQGSYGLELRNEGGLIVTIFLMLGTFDGLELPLWDVHESLPQDLMVLHQSADAVASGKEWCAIGKFDPTKEHDVLFYNVDLDVNGTTLVPVCTSTTVSALGNTVCCTVRAAAGVMGKFRFLVQQTENRAFVARSTVNDAIVVTPEMPIIVNVTGECAADSTKCVDGTELTFTGTNFNFRAPEYNFMTIGSSMNCTPTSVTGTTELTCTLAGTGGADEPEILIAEMKVQLTPDGLAWSAKKAVGGMAVGFVAPVPGWGSSPTGTDLVREVPPIPTHHGERMTIIGTFADGPHVVDFIPLENATSDGTPFCDDCVGASGFLMCRYHAPKTSSGTWFPLVFNKDTQSYLVTPTISMTLYPRSPATVYLTGDTGANMTEVTLTGSHYHPDLSSNRIVTMACTGDGCNVNAVSCGVKTAAENALIAECTSNNAADGVYTLGVQTLFGLGTWYDPATPSGYLHVEDTEFVEIVSPTHDMTIFYGQPNCSIVRNPVAFGFAVALGIVFLVVVVMLILAMGRYRLASREDKGEESSVSEEQYGWEDNGKGTRYSIPIPEVDQSDAGAR